MPAVKQTPLPTFCQTVEVGDELLLVETAVPMDLKFILDRAKQWNQELGFIPAAGIETLIKEGRCLIACVNGDPAGYILTSGGFRTPLVVRHNTVEESLWSRGIGKALVKCVLHWSRWTKRSHLLIRTRQDIARQRAINENLGGIVLGHDPHVGVRGKLVDIWRVDREPVLSANAE